MKKICFVSTTRADYGLLYWTMKGVQKEDDFCLQLIVSGMHLDPKFGETWRTIENDGFKINKKIPLGNLFDSSESVIQQLSQGIVKFFEAFRELKPDLLVVLGDRYEMLAVSQAAFFCGVPIAHISGGEVTEGAFDDNIRHVLTKLSSYHFTSTEKYRARVVQMGERPELVFNVGALGLENFKKLKLLTKSEIEQRLNFELKEKNFLITYHPVTAAKENAIGELINALGHFCDYGQIITMPNSDPGHDGIFNAISDYAQNRENVYVSTSLGTVLYLSLVEVCDVVIGNSSSGIVEAPFVGTPTLNIGARQKGRIQAPSVVNCEPHEIKEKIVFILNNHFEKSEIYGRGDSSEKIIKVLKNEILKTKRGFYDL